MSQSLVKRIVTMEQEAEHLYTEAQKQAEDILKEAREAAAALRKQTLSEAQRQAEQIITDGQAEAKAERAAIIQQAEAEAQQMEQTAAQHFDDAVEYVLNQVAGGSATPPSPNTKR
jgi:ATP synthase H subunit